MAKIPLVTKTKNYIVVKIPRMWAEVTISPQRNKKNKRKEMTESEMLSIVKRGEIEYKEGKTKVADSIMDLLGA